MGGRDSFNFIMIDYPGYGLSTGQPNEESIFEMSTIVFDYVQQHELIDRDKIPVMGYINSFNYLYC